MPPVAAVKVEGLAKLLAAIKKFDPEVRKEFNRHARAVLAQITAQAKTRASWSRRIPGSIGPTVTGQTIGVRVSKRVAPHGPLYERGQRGSEKFRHPLFGNRDYWYVSSTRPFLGPVVEANRDDTVEAMMRAIEDAKRKAGLA